MSLQAYIDLFSALTPADVERFPEVFAPDARFRDPFNDVRGVPAIQAVFRHMFRTCVEPRFVVLGHAPNGDSGYIEWVFHARVRGQPVRIEGMSRVRFDADWRVFEHIDHWDAAGQVYERIPGLGTLLRWLRRRLSVQDT